MRGLKRSYALSVAATVVAFAAAGCASTGDETTAPGASEKLSLSSASNFVYECLTNKGWDVELTWDGGIEVSSESVPEAQYDIYTADSNECWATVNDRILTMKPAEISEVYESELATRQCLIGRGIDVGTPPSKQQYIDTFQLDRWSAYGDSTALTSTAGEDEWRAINEACPQPAWSLGAP